MTAPIRQSLIDDTEGTTWDVTGLPTNVDVARPSVTVHLGRGAHLVRSVQVSAMLGPGQGRFTALRRFRIDTCERGRRRNCSTAADFHPIYTSPSDAFPGVAPRPVAPDLILRTFDVPDTMATHVRLVVAREPVHRRAGLRRRAGQRPGQPDRLRDRVGRRHGAARGRARGAFQ